MERCSGALEEAADGARQQERHYQLLSALQGLVKELPSSFQQRLSYTTLSDLALALLDGTVFEIVQGLLEIQHLTEKSLYNQRLRLQNTELQCDLRVGPPETLSPTPRRDLGSGCGRRPLALALLDGTVFEIVQGLLEIQHLTEKSLYNQRLRLQNTELQCDLRVGPPETLSPTPRRDLGSGCGSRPPAALAALQLPIGPVPPPRCIRFPFTEPRSTLWALKTRPLEPHAGQNLLRLGPSQASLQGWERPPEPLPAGEPEERAMGSDWMVEQSKHTKRVSVMFVVLRRHVLGAPKQHQHAHEMSLTTDHHNNNRETV
nr:PREDICTED: uncharacterized protein LOC102269006 [Bos mutus]